MLLFLFCVCVIFIDAHFDDSYDQEKKKKCHLPLGLLPNNFRHAQFCPENLKVKKATSRPGSHCFANSNMTHSIYTSQDRCDSFDRDHSTPNEINLTSQSPPLPLGGCG